MRQRRAAAFCGAIVVSMGAGVSGALRGQDVTVRSYVDRNEVGVNQQFILTVEVSGTQQVSTEPELPTMDDFALYLGSGTSQQMRMANGRTSVSVQYQYRFQATTRGHFEIGPVRMDVGGRVFQTEPISLSVVDQPTNTPPPTGLGGGGATTPTAADPQDLFLDVSANRRQVYQNEPVVLEYRIFTRVDVRSFSFTQTPATTGFWVEDYPLPSSPAVETVVRNGIQYASAVIKKMAVFPTSAGSKTIDPLSVEAQVLVRNRMVDPFDDFFGRSSLFNRNAPVLVSSDSVVLEVLPLPAEGRPRDFSGFVGDLSVSSSVDKTSTDTNEPLTLTVRLSGRGNVQTLTEPDLTFPSDFEVYPPEVSQDVNRDDNGVSGSKTFAYVLIPRAPGRRAIPSVEVSYFSPRTRTYETASAPAVDVEITGEPVTGPVVAARGRGAIEPLREDIRYIRLQPPAFRRVGWSPLKSATFWMVLVMPLIAVGGAVGVRRHRDRLRADVAFARHRRAGRVARKRLARARGLATEATQKDFYAEAGRALQGFLGDKLNIAEAGMVAEDVRHRLFQREVSEDTVARYLDLIEECNRQRFAPTEPNQEAMTGFLERAEGAMTDLNRELRR